MERVKIGQKEEQLKSNLNQHKRSEKKKKKKRQKKKTQKKKKRAVSYPFLIFIFFEFDLKAL